MRRYITTTLGVLALACGRPTSTGDAPTGAAALALGTVQDGGLPHAGCSCQRCEAARTTPARRRHVASLALVADDRVLVIDATPDVREQLAALRSFGESAPGRVDRTPIDGLFLTHAHIGHYLGLAHFGYEAMHTSSIPVYATRRMAEFLRVNGPWDQLVRLENIALTELTAGVGIPSGPFTITPFVVPHRDEYSDTVGYRIEGPRRSLVYIPDTEPWDRWPQPVERVLEGVAVAVVDGTFFSADELPGRDVAQIGHPLIRDTIARFGPRVARGELEVLFTHLNHSNPALEPNSGQRRELENAGFKVLAEGQRLPL